MSPKKKFSPPRPKKKVADDNGWTPCKMNIPIIGGQRIVDGKRLGDVGVFPDWEREPLIEVCALMDGVRLASVETEADAMKIGELMTSRCLTALRQPTMKEMEKFCPAWVRPWLGACKNQKKYVDPDPYIKATKK